MAITFNHTIVAAKDRSASATFFTELFGLPAAKELGPFLAVELNHGVSLDFAKAPDEQEIHPQHYAFLVSEPEFDAIYGRIRERGMRHWADPPRSAPRRDQPQRRRPRRVLPGPGRPLPGDPHPPVRLRRLSAGGTVTGYAERRWREGPDDRAARLDGATARRLSAEAYEALPEDVCRRIEIVDGPSS